MEVRADWHREGSGCDPFIKLLTQSLHRDCMHSHCQFCFWRLLYPTDALPCSGRRSDCLVLYCCAECFDADNRVHVSSGECRLLHLLDDREVGVSQANLCLTPQVCWSFAGNAYLGFLHMIKSERSTQMRHACCHTSCRWRRQVRWGEKGLVCRRHQLGGDRGGDEFCILRHSHGSTLAVSRMWFGDLRSMAVNRDGKAEIVSQLYPKIIQFQKKKSHIQYMPT